MKKVLVILIFFGLGLLSAANTWAQTPKATESATGKKEGLESLKELVQEIREKKKIKVYAGTVEGILAKTISLETRNGSKTVKVTDQTKIVFISQTKEPKLENILVGQFAIALGEVDQSKIMTAKTLNISTKSPINYRKAVFGIVKSPTPKNAILVNQVNGKESGINFDAQTKVKTAQQEVKIHDIKEGSKIALVGIMSPFGEVLARKIFLVPGNFLDLVKKFESKSTGSATQSATTPASIK